ncbi:MULTISPECIES: DUF898 family protein [unclassified Roseivivax]|uniref:DUF898 family protein n=1 Tax=unclassified Roseivivax TaxID=2639302 RepID=UPI0012690B01|nr:MULTISPECIES: DUF898 family protein [unclassified Roseivivax]
METDFAGRRGPLLALALKTGFLTVLTLGIYRFWMKTRLRRWYWSAIRPGGHPLEYVGDPWEKLLGFLIAVVILAFYIGVVNLILMFVSFSLFQGNVAAYGLSFLGVIPLWFYAQYRARRYILARTRWRGVRFALAPGAWGYAFRALGHWIVTILSLGLLWPRMTFWLEKYKTDRTYFGTARLVQEGRWTMLYPALKWIGIAIGLALLSTGLGFAEQPGAAAASGVAAALAGLYGVVYYRVETLRLLTETKRMGDVRLHFTPSAMKVLLIFGFGYLGTLAILALPTIFLGVAILGLQAADMLADMGAGDALPWLEALPPYTLIALSAGLYFAIFLMWSALTQIFVTMPLIRHYALRIAIGTPDGLAKVRQRPRDEAEQAEGFAEALDVGASI